MGRYGNCTLGVFGLLAVCCLLSASVHAQVPHLIRYQGQAEDSKGVPLEGPYTLTFRLYDAQTLGTQIWSETHSNVPLTGGHFSVLLGSVSTMTGVNWSVPRWLSIQVGTAPELSPRQRITSVPLAIRAETAENLTTPTAVQSNLIEFTRTAAAGSGTQVVTGMGFQPTAVWAFCTVQSNTTMATWGFGDAGGEGVLMRTTGATPDFDVRPLSNDRMVQLESGVNYMLATLDSLDADGFTLTWTKNGVGQDVECVIMGVR